MRYPVWTYLGAFVLGTMAYSAIDDDDLITYVTLPNHRIPKWNITYYNRNAVAPGYWFVAPYTSNGGEPSSKRWSPCQVGAHIFDQDGELVWTGSCEFENRNIFDFHVVDGMNGMKNLAMGLPTGWDATEKPFIVIYNNEMEEIHRLEDPDGNLDLHEVNVYEPTKVLSLVDRPERINMADFGHDGWVSILSKEIVELDIPTGLPIWRWNALDHISPDESYIWDASDETPDPDYLHTNSVDKNQNGDYLLSVRHTNTIYLISGQNGDIIWRLGGKQNDFNMDFTFSGQHDARFMSVNKTHMILSLFNNAANHLTVDEPSSSGMRIQLDLKTMKATCLNQYHHPTQRISSRQRGNFQSLPITGPNPRNNVLVSWTQNGSMSEFTHDGKLLMDARFVSDRFSTYRSYKSPWSSRPASYPPTVVASCHGVGVNGSRSQLSTSFWVSWNGATDISYWRFYARNNASSSSSSGIEIGTIQKRGFETSFAVRGYLDWISVQALGSDYKVRGSSPVIRTSLPDYWPEGIDLPSPDDPAAVAAAVLNADSAESTAAFPSTSTETDFGFLALSMVFAAGILVGVAGYAMVMLLSSVPRLFRWRVRAKYSEAEYSDESEFVESQWAK